ncbi:AAA family ATPase [Methylobacillus flagellatus]|uniref:Pilus assembly protein CpaE n=1 Tax=Methylobacillus flagellatus (strain ATCC 51484 / DSM 6875 / VKM B-1610 / KT) TaxID=265072 RepID=Q1H0S8_METFK|nr:pilus assembly protein CpaE [Methylobacillus flagellatus]ABE49909.1 pilus assembly protein CpaE [Methylobacillus flagellatus KT]
MHDSRNYIVVSNGDECIRWLRNISDHSSKFIFVEEQDIHKVMQLVDAVDINAVLLHMRSQDFRQEVALSPAFLQEIAFIEEISATRPDLPVLAMADTADGQLLLTIMRAGARDFIRVGSKENELLAILGRYSLRNTIRREQSAPQPSSGKITAVINARPGPDTTMLAIHLAQAMQETESTLLVDLGIPHADSLLFMGMQGKYSFVDVMRNLARVDATLIDTGFARHGSGLSVLSMPEEPGDDFQISPADIYTVLRTLRKHFSQVVINLGGVTRVDFLQLLLSAVDRTILVAEQSVPSCKRNYELLRALRAQNLELQNTGLVLDHYLPRLLPDADNIASSFDLPLLGLLPPSGMIRLSSVNTGDSIFELSSKSQYATKIREIAQALQDDKAKFSRKQGLVASLQRLFSDWHLSRSKLQS